MILTRAQTRERKFKCKMCSKIYVTPSPQPHRTTRSRWKILQLLAEYISFWRVHFNKYKLTQSSWKKLLQQRWQKIFIPVKNKYCKLDYCNIAPYNRIIMNGKIDFLGNEYFIKPVKLKEMIKNRISSSKVYIHTRML